MRTQCVRAAQFAFREKFDSTLRLPASMVPALGYPRLAATSAAATG
jgi:hypothetical protein